MLVKNYQVRDTVVADHGKQPKAPYTLLHSPSSHGLAIGDINI